jgi:hypothetical protein
VGLGANRTLTLLFIARKDTGFEKRR